MRRWNGWGDETVAVPLGAEARALITQLLGTGRSPGDAALADVVARVPASRLPAHPLVSQDPEQRVRHARGQSLPDWFAVRGGDIGRCPDGVAFPESAAQVRELLDFAQGQDVALIPYGGGTSVAGHINPPAIDRPVLTVSLARMDKLLHLDRASQLATFGAGTPGPAIEAQLASHGYTLGHYPQSWELATLGGWVASRSSGQQSLRYGRIEQMFAGGRVETPAGSLEIPTFPASSAGPDLREMILGSEGRMGIITEVKARVTPLPEQETFYVSFFPDWDSAVAALRTLAQRKVPLSMMRLSSAIETWTQLKLAGHARAIAWLDRYLRLRGAGEGKCMFTWGVTGTRAACRAALALAQPVIRAHGGIATGSALGKAWKKGRFMAPYLRMPLWEMGIVADTVETAVDWSRVTPTLRAVEGALREGLADIGERVHVYTHLSHLYPQGSSIYTTYLYRCGDSCEEGLARWKKLKHAASMATVQSGGTISHQHGVGADHAPYLAAEKGALGLGAIASLCRHFDPAGIMNPGKLLPENT